MPLCLLGEENIQVIILSIMAVVCFWLPSLFYHNYSSLGQVLKSRTFGNSWNGVLQPFLLPNQQCQSTLS